MSAGDQVLPTTNVPNGTAAPYPSPANPSSVGSTVNMGDTQGATQRQFALAGTPGVDVVDVHDSQTGASGSWTFVVRLNGGDRDVVYEVAQYLHTVRQQGTATVVCSVGDLVSPAAPAPGTFWENGGQTGPLVGGTTDGSLVTVGGLSDGSSTEIGSGVGAGVSIGAGVATPTPTSGNFGLNAQVGMGFAIAGVDQFVAGVAGIGIGNSGAHGIAISAGMTPSPSSNTVSVDAAGAVVISATSPSTTIGNASGTMDLDASMLVLNVDGNAWTWMEAPATNTAGQTVSVTPGGVMSPGKSIQKFNATLTTSGETAAITASISATSRIVATPTNAAGSGIATTVRYAALATNRVNGASGSFKISALAAAGTVNANDTSNVDIIVIDN